MSAIDLDPPWLDIDLGREMRVLSWAVARPGYVNARTVTWREVRDADLGEDLDVEPWLAAELAASGRQEHVCFLTSRSLSTMARETKGGATCYATVGLSNAEGPRRRPAERHAGSRWGTINALVVVDPPLSDIGLLEALSIAAEARTAAVIDHGPPGVTGTGTDCIAVAARSGPARYAGLHTEAGRAILETTYGAVSEGVLDWMNAFFTEPAHDGA